MNNKLKAIGMMFVILVTMSIVAMALGSLQALTTQSRIAPLSDSIGNNAPNTLKVAALPATYGIVDERIYTFSTGTQNVWYSTSNYTFYLPSAAYTYIDVRGFESGMTSTGMYFGIDQPDPCKGDVATMVLYEHPNMSEGVNQYAKNVPMQTSRVYYLGKGYHTVYVNVLANMNGIDSYNPPTVSPIVISVTATSTGNLQIKR